MIKAVTFDLWNTLYIDEPDASGGRKDLRAQRSIDLLASVGHQVGLDAIRAGFTRSHEEFDRIWETEHRSVPISHRVDVILHELDLEVSPHVRDGMAAILEEAALDIRPVPVDSSYETVAELAKQYSLALICDTGLTPSRVLRQIMADDGLAGFFQKLTFSDETGTAKPNPRQFLTTLDGLGVEPSEAVHVGDLVRTDIRGAKDAGMKAILFKGVTHGQEGDGLPDAEIDHLGELGGILRRWVGREQ